MKEIEGNIASAPHPEAEMAEIERLVRQFEDAVYKEAYYTSNNDPIGPEVRAQTRSALLTAIRKLARERDDATVNLTESRQTIRHLAEAKALRQWGT